MYAVRTWKSDGSTNVMGIDIAAKNLKSFAKDPATARQPMTEIVERLLSGEAIETRLAVFSIYG